MFVCLSTSKLTRKVKYLHFLRAVKSCAVARTDLLKTFFIAVCKSFFYHLRTRSLVNLKVSHTVKINVSRNFRHPYFHDCIFLDSFVIFKHWLDLYLGYVASQSVFLYMKQ